MESVELDDTEKTVLEMADRGFSNDKIADEGNISYRKVSSLKSKLKSEGLLERSGSKRYASWSKTDRAADQVGEENQKSNSMQIEEEAFVNHFLDEAESSQVLNHDLDQGDRALVGMIQRGDGYGFIKDNYPGEDVDERIDRLEEEGFIERTDSSASEYKVIADVNIDMDELPGANKTVASSTNKEVVLDEREIEDGTDRMAERISDYVAKEGTVYCRELIEEFEITSHIRTALIQLNEERDDFYMGRKGLAMEVSTERDVEVTEETPDDYPRSSTPIHTGWRGQIFSL